MIVRELVTLLGFKTDEASRKAAEARIDGMKKKLGAGMKDLQQGVQSMMSGDISGILSLSKAVLPVAAAAAAAVGLYKIGVAAISAASEVEDLTTQFEVMLGSSELAGEFVKDIRAMAAQTPFGTTDLAEAAKTMKQFGVETDQILPVLKMLGDVSGGNSQRMKQMALVFGQIQSTGRLMGQDLLQLINAGFNPLTIMAKQSGKSVLELKKAMEKGQISAEDVTKAFQIATSKGGMFFNGMAKASKTLSGVSSTLKDDWKEWLATIGERPMQPLKGIILELSKFIKSPIMRTIGAVISEVLWKVITIGQFLLKVLMWALAPLQAVLWVFWKIKDVMEQVGKLLWSIFKPLFDWLGGVIKTALSPITNFIMGMIDYLKTAWNDMMRFLLDSTFGTVEKLISLLNKIPGVKIDTEGIEKIKREIDALVTFDDKMKRGDSAGKGANSFQFNNEFNFGGGAGGSLASAKSALSKAATAAFSIELKKLIVATL